jgi:hypothetical protein
MKLEKSTYRAGMYLTGGIHPVEVGNPATPRRRPPLTAKQLDQATGLVKELHGVVKQAAFEKRWQKIVDDSYL